MKKYTPYKRNLGEVVIYQMFSGVSGNLLDFTKRAGSFDYRDEIPECYRQLADENPYELACAIGFVRKKGFVRTEPIKALVAFYEMWKAYNSLPRAAVNVTNLKDAKTWFIAAYREAIKIPDDLFDFKMILKHRGHGEGGKLIKRLDSWFLNNKLTEYWALKYNARSRGYNLTDVIKTSHPVPTNPNSERLFKYLIKGDFEGLTQVEAYELLKANSGTLSDNAKANLILDNALPHDIVTSVGGMNKQMWEALLPGMPATAMLRNINAMDKVGVFDSKANLDLAMNKIDPKNCRLLPYQYLRAVDFFVENGKRKVAIEIEKKLDESYLNLGKINGDVLLLTDISGSMTSHDYRSGYMLSMTVAKCVDRKLKHKLFNDKLHEAPSKDMPISEGVSKIRSAISSYTETSLGIEEALKRKEVFDLIVIVTDEGQNAGNQLYEVYEAYKEKINPGVRMVIIDIGRDNINRACNPDDTSVVYFKGFSDKIVPYIRLFLDYGSVGTNPSSLYHIVKPLETDILFSK